MHLAALCVLLNHLILRQEHLVLELLDQEVDREWFGLAEVPVLDKYSP